MTITQYPNHNHLAIQQAMKPDERIVCTNATVVMDSNQRLSYFDNDKAVCLIGESE